MRGVWLLCVGLFVALVACSAEDREKRAPPARRRGGGAAAGLLRPPACRATRPDGTVLREESCPPDTSCRLGPKEITSRRREQVLVYGCLPVRPPSPPQKKTERVAN